MPSPFNRRSFLRTAATGGTLVGLDPFSVLSGPAPASAADPHAATLPPDIEPLVRLLEETPRQQLLEELGARVHRGLSYGQLLAALLLAGVRNIQPRPAVGFKFHAVMAVNSVHLACMSAADADRWLALFWAMDYFKDSQARNQREGGWRMHPVDEAAVPAPDKARQSFTAAMDDWNEPAADAAAAALARTAGSSDIFEILYRYGARDFRSIGHKAIFVANSERVLTQIGWRYAESVVRSLAYALLMHEGGNPAQGDVPADRPWRRNQKLAQQIPATWQDGKPSISATAALLDSLRHGSDETSCEKVVELLRDGAAPQSIWDGLFCGAAELLLRQPAIVALHAVTSTNALHYAYQASGNDSTRRLLMLQNAAFLPLFRQAIESRTELAQSPIDALPAAQAASSPNAVQEIFAALGSDRQAAVRQTLAYLQAHKSPEELMATGRRLVLVKGDDPHDYKFSVAALEDYYHISPAWRDRYLAACMLRLPGSNEADNQLVHRIRAAL